MAVNNETELKQKYNFLSEFFSLVEVGKEEKSDGSRTLSFKCCLCKKENKISAATNATSNLKRHIQDLHPSSADNFITLMEENRNKRGRKRTNDSISVAKKSRQLTLAESLSKYPVHLSQVGLDELIINFIIQDIQPFTIVQSEAFKRLVLTGRPGKSVMSYQTLMTKIDALFEDQMKQLRVNLKDTDFVCITADLWSGSHRGYLGVTVHWLNPNQDHESAALCCRQITGHHTYDVIGAAIDSVLRENGIRDKTIFAVTDSASNFKKAFIEFCADLGVPEDLSEENNFTEITEMLNFSASGIKLPPHLKCSAHKLNLVATVDLEKALKKNKEFARIYRGVLAKCTSLWNKQQRSTLAADKIHELLQCSLVVANATRWNSTFKGLKRIEDIMKNRFSNLNEVMNSLQLPLFTTSDEEFIYDYCRIMGKFAQALDTLQGEKSVTMGYLLPVLTQLKIYLAAEKAKSKICFPLCDALTDAIDIRFEEEMQDKRIILAAVSHPKFKVCKWIKDKGKQCEAWNLLLEEITHFHSKDESCLRFGEEKVAKNEDFFQLEDDPASLTGTPENILRLYQESIYSVEQLKEIPILCAIFRRYNTAIPSSAAVERLFSHAKDIFGVKRHSLKSSNFEKHLLLRVNMKKK